MQGLPLSKVSLITIVRNNQNAKVMLTVAYLTRTVSIDVDSPRSALNIYVNDNTWATRMGFKLEYRLAWRTEATARMAPKLPCRLLRATLIWLKRVWERIGGEAVSRVEEVDNS